jgi:hypothetical protein
LTTGTHSQRELTASAAAGPQSALARRFEEFDPLHFLLLLSLALGGTTLLATVLVHGVDRIEFEIYLLLLVLYAAATVSFLLSQSRSGRLRFFDIPVFMTIVCFLRFGLVPLAAYLDPDLLSQAFHQRGYGQLNRSLGYFMLGMFAFWTACHLSRRRKAGSTDMTEGAQEAPKLRPVNWAVILFLTSLATRTYVTWNYGYGYGLDADAYFDNLALFQFLMFFSDLGVYALLLATIEMCSHPRDALRVGLFVVVFLNELFWGALSGMKYDLLRGFLILALVVSITKARIEKKWLVATLLGLIVVYPVHDRYRSMLRGGQVDVRRVGSLGEAGSVATLQTAKIESGWSGWLRSGWQRAISRLDLLQPMAIVMSLDAAQADRVRTEERWWMLPFYPLVPRLLWPNKPILNGGVRLSLALGSTKETSTALTYPGDLYMDYGLPGILVGMLVLGVVGQLLTNAVTGPFDKRSLFFYSVIFVSFANMMETQAFPVWAGVLKTMVIFGILKCLIYGRPRKKKKRIPPIESIGRGRLAERTD